MVLSFILHERRCGTCHYWQAERELCFRNGKIHGIYHQVKQGKCPLNNNILRNAMIPACAAYKRWNELPEE